MPFYPDIPTWDTSTINTQTFLGLNRGLSITEGEMSDMLNLCSDHSPVLATRGNRGVPVFPVEGGGQTSFDGAVSGMLGTDKVIVCADGKVFVDGVQIPLTLSNEEHMLPKHMVAMGAYVCIWPDKKYFSLADETDYGDMGRYWQAADGDEVTAMMCRKDGTDYDLEAISKGDTAPEEPEDKQLWLDTSGENHVLKQYSAMHAEWVQVATTFIKLSAPGIGDKLKDADVVHISGVRAAGDASAPALLAEQTLSIPVEAVSLYSTFQTTHQGGTNWVSTEASYVTTTRKVKIEGLPESATIKSATATCSVGYSMYGSKLFTINRQAYGEGTKPTIPVEVVDGEVTLKFDFRSKNNATVSGRHGGTLVISDITVDVVYEGDASPAGNPDADQLEALNTTNIIYGCGKDYIIVAGLLHQAQVLDSGIVVDLKIPDLDYVCESNNRLWGCSYADVDGKLTNEIRCCALGDFRNWYRFEGTSMDSYVLSVGSDGPFTAAYNLRGMPLIFKEGYLHKITGTQPSNYTLNTIKCRGVQEGSWRSLATVNELLYYKARGDVMAYDGATPYSVSEKLGTDRYYDAVGGAYRDKYYICMRDEKVHRHVYVLDTAKGLWHKEDESNITNMASADGDLVLAIEHANGTWLRTVGNESNTVEVFPWQATFGTFGYAYERAKYLSRFNIRAQLEAGSEMTFEIMYDSSGKWEKMGTMRAKRLQTFLLPIIPRKCDHCQIRISGVGKAAIYSIARVFEEGGN